MSERSAAKRVVVTKTQGTTDAAKARYTLTFPHLPGQAFGPYPFNEAKSQLEFACDLSMPTARGALYDAFLQGQATLDFN